MDNTPLDQVLEILTRPVRCGYKNCGYVFGIGPLPDGANPKPMQEWERRQLEHNRQAGHKVRKLAYISDIVI